MDLRIEDLLPSYFPENRKQTSEVWGKDLRFDQGEFVKIVAPSGSGKTSLMHFLYGVRQDYQGKVSYDERAIRKFSAEEMAGFRKQRVSIVFQDMRLFPEQSVFENIDIKRRLDPFHPAEKIGEMAERLGIGDKLKARCGNCSYGEQQRVAIIRSLMQPFDLLLLDEPFSHLDNNNSERAMELMVEEARRRKASIVFADLERIDYFPFTKIFHL
jgi:ABC-type lipoprotein export system ATPase subunit